MYRNILLDLDDTILDFHRAEGEAFRSVMLELGVEPTRELVRLYSRINMSQWKLLELGKLTLAETKVNRYRLLFAECGIEASPQEATARYEELLSTAYYTVDGAVELLQSLYGRYRLYIATNGTPKVQRSRIAGAGISKYFDGVFISAELGASKPDRDFFEACFRNIPDFQREETVIVGDSLTSDIRGGKNAGIDTVWYNPRGLENDGGVTPTREARGMEEIEKIFG